MPRPTPPRPPLPAVASQELVVEPEITAMRLDRYLVGRFPQFSRNALSRLIHDQGVSVNGAVTRKPAFLLDAGDTLALSLPTAADLVIEAEDIPLSVLHEDEHLAVIDKPAGMLTVPSGFSVSGTLVNAIKHRFQRLSDLHRDPARSGIVHRLDRETSGLLIVVFTARAHEALGRQFHEREVRKEYAAIVEGAPRFDENIALEAIGPSPETVTRQVIAREGGKAAETRFDVARRFRRFALLSVKPRTGRQHQIRVHLAHHGHPVLADRLYGKRKRLTLRDLDREAPGDQVLIGRHALHARGLAFVHPISEAPLAFEAPLPADFQATLDALERHDAPR